MNSSDIELSISSLQFKKEQMEKKGKGNIKAEVNKKVEEKKAEEAKI